MKLITRSITNKILSNNKELLIEEFTFSGKKENELLLFFKPECFLIEDPIFIERITEMVMRKLQEYSVDIAGSVLLGGNLLENLGIMDRHYGFINNLSRNASKLITGQKLVEVQNNLGITDIKDYRVLGGHEFLQEFRDFNETSLGALWLSKKCIKPRSGFYIQQYLINGHKFILVNGFHPLQLKQFTEPSRKILVLLLHSDTDWKILKNDLVGNTFPEKAISSSIRGELFTNKKNYGIQEVTVANNHIHLSAGPFEALFEINNFLKDLADTKFNVNKTNMFKFMIDHGLNKTNIENCLQNPPAIIKGQPIDLFTFTEDKNSRTALSDYMRYFKEH